MTLGDDLDAVGLHDIAARARAGEFNDFFGEYTMPQHALLGVVRTDSRLSDEERGWLVGHIIDGKYDSTQAESDEWSRSDEGRTLFGELLRGGQE